MLIIRDRWSRWGELALRNRRETFQFVRPILNDDDFVIAYFRSAVLDHFQHEEPAVGRDIVALTIWAVGLKVDIIEERPRDA